MTRFRPATPTVKTALVRAAVEARIESKQSNFWPPFENAMEALMRDLRRVDREQAKQDAEDAAENARDEARRKPPVTIQKVMAVIRKAGLTLATHDSRSGSTTGIEVRYGDWDRRTWVKVEYTFSSSFGYYHRGTKEQVSAKEKQMINDDLFGTAARALRAAGLSAEPVRDESNHLLHYLKVTL